MSLFLSFSKDWFQQLCFYDQFVPWVSLPLQNNTASPVPNFFIPTPLRIDNSTLQSFDTTYDTLDQNLTRRLQEVRQVIKDIYQVSHTSLFHVLIYRCLAFTICNFIVLVVFYCILFKKPSGSALPTSPPHPVENHFSSLSVNLNLLSSKKKILLYVLLFIYFLCPPFMCGSVPYQRVHAGRKILISTPKLNFSVSLFSICSPIHVYCIRFPLFMPKPYFPHKTCVHLRPMSLSISSFSTLLFHLLL